MFLTLHWFGRIILRPLNVVAGEHNIGKLNDLRDLWQGDYNLLAEPPDFSGLTGIPETCFYIGPLIANLNTPVSSEIIDFMKGDKPVIYFAMGSSGRPSLIKDILEGFTGQPFNVVSPMKKNIQGLNVKVPSNVLLTGWLPALEVSRMADISVIHGGIGTVMTAALAGKPVVGVGMMYEQEYNIDCLVRKGFAKRVRRTKLTADTLNGAIKIMLADEIAKRKARDYSIHMEKSLKERDQAIRDFFRH